MLLLNSATLKKLSLTENLSFKSLASRDKPLSSNQTSSLEDTRLVALSLSGDSRAFEVLVRRYQKLVYNVIFQMIRNHEATADLCQETFLKAFKGLPGFRPEARFKPWLLKIASNTTINYLRQAKLQTYESLEEQLEDNPSLEPTSADSPEMDVELHFSQRMLSDALQKLSPAHRQLFILRYQHDFNYADIATITDEPETTIKSSLFRIREKLRKLLVKELSNTTNIEK